MGVPVKCHDCDRVVDSMTLLHCEYNNYMGIVDEREANVIVDGAIKDGARVLHTFDEEQTIRITMSRSLDR